MMKWRELWIRDKSWEHQHIDSVYTLGNWWDNLEREGLREEKSPQPLSKCFPFISSSNNSFLSAMICPLLCQTLEMQGWAWRPGESSHSPEGGRGHKNTYLITNYAKCFKGKVPATMGELNKDLIGLNKLSNVKHLALPLIHLVKEVITKRVTGMLTLED